MTQPAEQYQQSHAYFTLVLVGMAVSFVAIMVIVAYLHVRHGRKKAGRKPPAEPRAALRRRRGKRT